MPDFNASTPPVSVTNPAGNAPGSPAFPAHVYKHAADDSNGGIVVAWDHRTAIYNDVLLVADEDAKAKALKQGYSVHPVLSVKK